jgi:hypothetical protein
MTGERDANSPPEPERWPVGRSILERIRNEVNHEMSPLWQEEVPDAFTAIYLTSRDSCIPDAFVDEDLIDGIHSMYYVVFDAMCVELRRRLDSHIAMNIVIDPSYEDTTNFVVHTFDRLLLSGGIKAWNFHWASEDEMARDLEDWYRRAADAAGAVPEGLAEELDDGHVVRLGLRRIIFVRTDDPEVALERALAWTSNEDDADVRLLLEEIPDYTASRLTTSTPDKPDRHDSGGD